MLRSVLVKGVCGVSTPLRTPRVVSSPHLICAFSNTPFRNSSGFSPKNTLFRAFTTAGPSDPKKVPQTTTPQSEKKQKQEADYDMFKPEAAWDWKHPMTFALFGAVCVMQYTIYKKRQEIDEIEADARQRGVILEPTSWDHTLDHDTTRWQGDSNRFSKFPRTVDRQVFLNFSVECCNRHLPSPTAIIEKVKFDKLEIEDSSNVGEPRNVSVRIVFQTYDPETMKTKLNRFAGTLAFSEPPPTNWTLVREDLEAL